MNISKEKIAATREVNQAKECKLCYKRFKNSIILSKHERLVHKHEKDYLNRELTEADLKHPCSICEKKFVNKRLLNIHLNAHKVENFEFLKKESYKPGKKTFRCKLCYIEKSRFGELVGHFLSIHQSDLDFLHNGFTEQDLTFHCRECELKFISDNCLEYHLSRFHPSLAKKKTWTNPNATTGSTRTKSTGNEECKLCYKTFKYVSVLRVHEQKGHKNDVQFLNRELTEEDLKYPCSICDKKFVTKLLLKSHTTKHQIEKYEFLREEAYNDEKKTFKCKLCYSERSRFGELVDHVTKIHKDDLSLLQRKLIPKDYIFHCGECELSFVSDTCLDYHTYKTHGDSETIPYCKLCQVKFKSGTGYLQHKYHIHRTELVAFKRNYNEEDLIFNCSSCSIKLATKNSLDYHFKKSHTAKTSEQNKARRGSYFREPNDEKLKKTQPWKRGRDVGY